MSAVGSNSNLPLFLPNDARFTKAALPCNSRGSRSVEGIEYV